MDENKTPRRTDFPVLVFDAHERMSVAVIRSLGRAGYPVHACSPHRYAAGSRSIFTTCRAICPDHDHVDFLQWLREYCATHRIRCLIPTEPMLLAIRPVFLEFAALLPLSNAESIVYRGINKFDLFSMLCQEDAAAKHPADNLPPLILLRRDNEIPSATELEALGLPVFIKVDADYSVDRKSATYSAASVEEARTLIVSLLKSCDRLVIQGYVPAIGVGAFLLQSQGKTQAEFMHMRLHEIPLQGWSSYSESWRNEDILRDARRKLKRLGWEGVAMMEYRWNPANGKFALIEMNGRFWGSLHLALYAGVDFPALLLDAFRGSEPDDPPNALIGVQCRDPFLEAKYVVSRCRSSNAGVGDKLRAVAEYIRLTLDPRVRSASLFPGDRKLIFWQCWQYFVNAVKRSAAKGAQVTKVERTRVGD